MSTMQTHEWAQAFFSENVIYPGHPLVTATMIMDRYENLAHAEQRFENQQFLNALSDSFIPGAGCAVHRALDVLRLVQGSGGVEAAKALAADYWDGWERQHANNKGPAAKGRMQAEQILPHFLARLEGWITGKPLPSIFRLSYNGSSAETISCKTA